MEVKQAIEGRRSIRRFKPDPIPEDILQELLEAARLAPSGSNLQPWRFLAVKSEAMREKLVECTYHLNFIKQAPLTMVCCVDLTAPETRPIRRQELLLAGATVLDDKTVEEYQRQKKRDFLQSPAQRQ